MKIKLFSPSLSSEDLSIFEKNTFPNIQQSFRKTLNESDHNFFRLKEYEDQTLQQCNDAYERFKTKKYFIHVGMGGSSLGAQAIIETLAPKKLKDNFIFLDNIDPINVEEKMTGIDLKQAVIFIVSKSGRTIETRYLYQYLKDKGAPQENFVFSVSNKSSILGEIATQNQNIILDIPSGVGGRFSALSPVGIFPSKFAGINPRDFFVGAKEVNLSLVENLGSFLYLNYLKGKDLTCLFTYSARLKNFRLWFEQLWSESLGKEERGFIPIGAEGAKDQHSLLQSFTQGPRRYFQIILSIESSQKTPLQELFDASLQGVLNSFEEQNLAHCHFRIEDLKAKNLGELFFYFQCLTVFTATCLGINPFDQPGVEISKKQTLMYLEKHKRPWPHS